MMIEQLNSQQDYMPDVLSCLANLSADEVFTPPELASFMLDQYPDEVWSNPELRFLDPCCKSGVLLREAAARLMVGLSEAIPDPEKRREHIFVNMLYGLAITELTAEISRRTLYYTKDPTNPNLSAHPFPEDKPEGNILYVPSKHSFKKGRCTICGAPESLEREGMENYAYAFIHHSNIYNMNFDVILGNPPYQLADSPDHPGSSASPIYHLFVERALEYNPRYLSLIIPARWYSGGKGLESFRGHMIQDRSLRLLVDYPVLYDVFPGVKIRGGVCYFLRDANYNGNCEVVTMVEGKEISRAKRDLRQGGDVLIRSNEAVSVFDKVQSRNERHMSDLVSSRNPFGFSTTFKGYSDKKSKSKSVKLYLRGGIGWVAPKQITQNQNWVDLWKVVTPKAHDYQGRFEVIEPNSACTETYLVAGVFSSEDEARNYAAYLATRFARFLISLRKNSHNMAASTFAFVPVLDMSKEWTDEKLYKRYGLTQKEIDHIEATIKEM